MLPQNQPPCTLDNCSQQISFNQSNKPINYSYSEFQTFQPFQQPIHYSYQPPQPQYTTPSTLDNCSQQISFNQGNQPINYSYSGFQTFQPFQQPIHYSYQPPQPEYTKPSIVDTELNNLKNEVLQLKQQISCLKEIADQQLESIKMIVTKVDSIPQFQPQIQSKSTINKRKPKIEPVETVNKRVRQTVNYSEKHSGNSPLIISTTTKPVVEITNEVEDINTNSSLYLPDLLEKTNEEMFEDGDYYVDKSKPNVVTAMNSNNWIVYVTTDKDTGRKLRTPKKMALASDLFDHLFTNSSTLSQYINRYLKKNIHFILTNVPYFNSEKLLLTRKGIEELINRLSLKGNAFDPKDMAVWKGMIEELK
jgi:hypothetical protein